MGLGNDMIFNLSRIMVDSFQECYKAALTQGDTKKHKVLLRIIKRLVSSIILGHDILFLGVGD